MKIVKPSVTLLWVTEDIEKMIEVAGRTCYKSEDVITDESAAGFVTGLRKSGHHAMLEHAVASFRIVTDKGITHEIVRHRIASYAQESTRYCNYSKDKFGSEISVIEPPNLGPFSREHWLQACRVAEEMYFEILSQNLSPQIARSVLPHCLKTEIVMMANMREWRHFISLRAHKTAHPQIRPLAMAIWAILNQKAPSLFEDLSHLITE